MVVNCLQDARAFTDYRPNCIANWDLQRHSNTFLNNHAYRLWLQQQEPNSVAYNQCNAIAPIQGGCCGCNVTKPITGAAAKVTYPQSTVNECTACNKPYR